MTRNPHEPRLARVAAMVADPARSRMLAYLLSGECASASELAKAASVTPATASGHLAQLLEARFVACEPRGRHRYYRLADADVAHALEALAVVAERGEHEQQWASPERARLRDARCCYGHLAGRLGTRLFDGLMAADGLYQQNDGAVTISEQVLYQARIALPSSVQTGSYTAPNAKGETPFAWKKPSTPWCLQRKKNCFTAR